MQNCREGNPIDFIRKKYISKLADYTKRNVICYYSGFLSNPGAFGSEINDMDINHLMATICNLNKQDGLDLILHTPGGSISATEAVVNYLKNIFGNNIRAIVPQICMSAGTMICCSCKSIVMGKQSSIGPIDP